jgi:helicase required for RNAi-mediated heterochromatin assembly 1
MERWGKRVRWTHTRRLAAGTLVALSTSTDNFATVYKLAIVVDRSIRGGLECNPRRIQIFWANLEDTTIDPNEEFVMMELSSYLHASHIYRFPVCIKPAPIVTLSR